MKKVVLQGIEPGPLVKHACITVHDTCLWDVGGLSNIPQKLLGCTFGVNKQT